MNKLQMRLEGDTVIVGTRTFDAEPELVYRAHTDPAIVQRWCTGPDGWRMTVCENDARPGGKIRYEWQNDDGHGFSLTGEFVELVPFSRLVHIERMHLPDTTPDNRVETVFEPFEGGTRMTMRMNLPDQATRDAMIQTGMEAGMEISYQRLEREIAAGGLA
ncbi:MAG: SRPBCC domain-containing protein [Planctomycetes bacterium]|nr:SRPBCC domain-containing protein [Planctomycetota bacterium]